MPVEQFPEEHLDRAASNGWEEIRAAVGALPERQRTTVFLRHYADLDYEQIADVLGITRGTVAATLHQAHEKLREVLAEVRT
jgi:RNA polymerase sigma factor (sigma-70 family)